MTKSQRIQSDIYTHIGGKKEAEEKEREEEYIKKSRGNSSNSRSDGTLLGRPTF